MIHLAGPVVLAAALAGAGVYGLLARRNAVLVLIGAELLLNAVNVLLVTAGTLPAGGLAALSAGGPARATAGDPLLPGPVLAIVVITIAAAEIGLALAVVLLTFRQRGTSDLTELRELGEGSPTYDEHPDAGELPPPASAPETPPGDDRTPSAAGAVR
ncbi:MAG: NADH-quinone oxidoreductase subunit [Actinomycetota bacterium]|nr:NADH-quinone oxidoreductase subunit [Actinomycetota bacterium]